MPTATRSQTQAQRAFARIKRRKDERVKAFELQLMPVETKADALPKSGKNLVVIAQIGGVLYLKIFGDGQTILDTDEMRANQKQAKELAGRVAAFRKNLQGLWPTHQLTPEEKQWVIAAANSIADQTLAEKFVSFAREFPTLIHTCGLCQAIAFARAKGDHHRAYADDLAAVVLGEVNGRDRDGKNLFDDARGKPVMEYLRLTREALSAAVWLKRYVEALTKDRPEAHPPLKNLEEAKS